MDKFEEHLNDSSRAVRAWAKWRQEMLGGTASEKENVMTSERKNDIDLFIRKTESDLATDDTFNISTYNAPTIIRELIQMIKELREELHKKEQQ